MSRLTDTLEAVFDTHPLVRYAEAVRAECDAEFPDVHEDEFIRPPLPPRSLQATMVASAILSRLEPGPLASHDSNDAD